VVELQSFLGLASYYRRFIEQFATIAHPLTVQTGKKKRDALVWGEAEIAAFEKLRSCLISPPILAYPDFSKEFQIYTDASNYGIGAVLSQIQDGKEVVIAYASKHLDPAEMKYSTIEREALAVIKGIERFRYYLLDEPFVIISDHRPLQWLNAHKDENSRLGRWAILLAGVKYTIKYRPGRVHENADCLSRIPVASIEARPTEYAIAMTEQSLDPLCCDIRRYLEEGILSDENRALHPIWVKEIELYSIQGGLLCRNSLPTSKKRRRFSQLQTVVPYSLRRSLVKEYHDSPLAGHLAFLRTYLRVQDKFYWPEMRNDIEEYCKTCETCAKQRRTPVKTFLLPLEITSTPFEVLGLDFLGPIRPHSLQGNNHVLVITDYFTKWVEVVALPNQTALTTCKALMEKVVLYHGPPKKIITDRGSNFTSKLFNHLCQALNTKHTTTTAYHPQSNGLTERFNKTVVEMIRKYIAEGFENWEEALGLVASAYRNSVHSSTMETPYFLNHGRDPSMVVDQFLIPQPKIVTPRDYKSQLMQRLNEAFALARENLVEARARQKIQYDKRAKELLYEVGDKVLLDVRVVIPGTSKKLNPIYQGPYRIFKVHPNHTVEIRPYDGGRVQLTHVNRLKPLSESMVWKDEDCVDFKDLRQNKPIQDSTLERQLFTQETVNSPVPDQPVECNPLPKEKGPSVAKRKAPPPVAKLIVERRSGLRPWSALRRNVPYNV
jgi:transposase InsO family protein